VPHAPMVHVAHRWVNASACALSLSGDGSRKVAYASP